MMNHLFEEFFFVIPVFIVPLIVFILFYMMKSSDKLEKIEEGKNSIFSVKCAGVIFLTPYNGPYIRVTLYDDFILIKARHVFIFKYDEFSIKLGTYFLKTSFSFIHNKSEFPNKIEIHLNEYDEFKKILDSKNVQITD